MSDRAQAIADAAYQGTPGAFSEDAARAMLGVDAALLPCPTLEEVFAAVAGGRANRAVVPVENTLAGAVPGCDDLIGRHAVRIVGERVQHIAHALIGRPGSAMSAVRRVLSHPVALAQCRRFFAEHAEMAPVPVFDTAGAVAEIMSRGDVDSAAIAGRRAAEVYGGVVLADDIQDQADNFTRFLLLESGVWDEAFVADRKTSLVCVLANAPGALAHALMAFADQGLNVSRLESRPIRESPFEYRFFLDVDPTADAAALAAAMASLRACSRVLRVLGHYANRNGVGSGWQKLP
jgi:prephenate dehydratase